MTEMKLKAYLLQFIASSCCSRLKSCPSVPIVVVPATQEEIARLTGKHAPGAENRGISKAFVCPGKDSKR